MLAKGLAKRSWKRRTVSGVIVCAVVAVAVTGGLRLPQNLLPGAAAATAVRGEGPSGSSGQLPVQAGWSSVAARVAPLVLAPGLFDTSKASPRVFGPPAALAAGVVGEVVDRRTLRDSSKTTWQLGAAVGDMALPGQGLVLGRGGVTAKPDGSLQRGGDPGGDREGSSGPAVRIAGTAGGGQGNGGSDANIGGGDGDGVVAEVGEVGSRVRLGSPLGGAKNVKAVVGAGKSLFAGGGPGGGDLLLEASSAGLKESIVLRSAPAGEGAFVVRYPLLLDPGLTPEPAVKGSPYSGVVVKDEAGRVVWVLPDGDAVDSAPDPVRAQPVKVDTALPAAVGWWLPWVWNATPAAPGR